MTQERTIQVIDMTVGAIPAYQAQMHASLTKQLEDAKRDQACAEDDLDAAEHRLKFADAAVDAAEHALEAHSAAYARRPAVKA